ncbi:MAG: hypothetical protein K2L96_07595 [Muribaculaceae bacterium]|nr:hypothetical protein [Muribaculaceae bacterium]
MKRILASVAATVMVWFGAMAQIVTTSPTIVQEDSPNVVLTYHADSPLGNGGLKGLSAGTPVYAHIGVITNLSKSDSDWKYVQTDWPASDGSNAQTSNMEKNKLTYVSPNTYTLTLGSLRSYFGITNATEHIKKIALVMRNADGSKQGKTASGGDIFVEVLGDGFGISFSHNAESTLLTKDTEITFTLNSTAAADLSISVNGTTIASVKGNTALTASYTFTNKGNYTVEGKGELNGVVKTESVNIAYPGASVAGTYPGGKPKMGPVKNADGTVTFCIAAPGKSSAILVPSWDDYNVLDKNIMKYQDYEGNRYFWTTVSGLKDNEWYPYYFIIDTKYKVADPYAELVLDCYSDKWLDPNVWPDMPQYPYELFNDVMLAVYRGDLNTSYKFSDFTIPEHESLVIYEMLLRDFTGTDGEANANGTVRQAIAKIPYIKNLGFNAVELMPIMEFNGNNSWGYNTNFYFAPDKAYGSPTDYRDFIEACHKEGIAVILDIVFNQSDGLHPWYQLYAVGSNPFYNKTAPHAYSVLNDWNQGHALVQQQWTDCLEYWMKNYNVDGFRFDLVKGLGDNDSYKNGTDSYNASRIARMKRLHAVIKSVKPDGIHINENLAGSQEEIEMGKDGELQWANINNNSCQFTMGYAEDNGGAKLTAFLSTLQGNRPWGSTVSYAESHDEQRMGYKNNTYGISAVKNNKDVSYKRLGSLAAQMLLTPGPKMVWQFGELGADQSTKDKNGGNNTDPKIVLWGWLNQENPKALMETYSKLINLRMSNPELFKESATFVTSGLGTAYTNNRVMRLTAGNKEVICFINPNTGGADQTVTATSTVLNYNNSQLICASPGFEPTLNGTGTSVSVNVPPHCFAVFATKTVTGIDNVTVQPEEGVSNVRGGQGCIIIDGDYSTASVYTLDGRLAAGLEGLTPGLYIVRVDGKASKVAVR